ncbi:HotDog domain-containing protein [Umbelopsis sp. PMI_123]|nr:HotDog domain-containing protein [Umbelopsis sp. PMI_123]
MSIENAVPVSNDPPHIVTNGVEVATVEILDQNEAPESDEEHIARLEQEMAALPIVNKLRDDSNITEVVAYGHMSPSAYQHSLTASTLRGRGKIAVRPLKFFNQDKTECYMICHLGRSLCGHDGIIHGGMLGTLLDEHLAYVTVPSLPNHTGFTARLEVNYRAPVKADQWVIIGGKLDSLDGRKAWADAWIEAIDQSIKYTEARALYVSPRQPMAKVEF